MPLFFRLILVRNVSPYYYYYVLTEKKTGIRAPKLMLWFRLVLYWNFGYSILIFYFRFVHFQRCEKWFSGVHSEKTYFIRAVVNWFWLIFLFNGLPSRRIIFYLSTLIIGWKSTLLLIKYIKYRLIINERDKLK